MRVLLTGCAGLLRWLHAMEGFCIFCFPQLMKLSVRTTLARSYPSDWRLSEELGCFRTKVVANDSGLNLARRP
jgi:hypothetical protein